MEVLSSFDKGIMTCFFGGLDMVKSKTDALTVISLTHSYTWTKNIVCLSSSFFFSPSFFLSFPSIQKLYVHLSALQAVEQMSSLFFSLTHLLASLSLALSVSCGLWFVPN